MNNMKCKIQHISEHSGRIIAVSDIHGYAHYLRGVLEKVRFSKEDALIIVGDMIEKGPESLETVRYILKLREENEKVYAVLGNVDYSRLCRFFDDSPEGDAAFLAELKWTRDKWGRGFFLDMLDELGIIPDNIREEEIADLKKQLRLHFAQELGLFASMVNDETNDSRICKWLLPTVLTIGNFMFVHGGIPTEDLTLLEKVDAVDCMKLDGFLNKAAAFTKTVVVGHWPVYHYRDEQDCLNPLFDYKKHVIAIDGGCALKYGCQLNALIIPNPDADMHEITYTYFDDYPVLRAAKAQKAKPWTIRMRYFDCLVDILEEKDDLVKLRHISTGKEMKVPKSYLYFDYFGDGKVSCADCSDAYLEVEPGDTLAVVAKTSEGYVVKKEGVLGWYKI